MLNRALTFLLLISCSAQIASAQTTYQPNWESLDRRPMPQWWTNAKFGIFIHWGPYSVPAFSKVGAYSEWYWKTLRDPNRVGPGHNETKAFHERVYGKSFTYPDFVPMFTCDMYDAEQWADLFQKSGAKYVVLTAKHHDGYTLWPSQQATQSWGRPWSSTNSGPERDLYGELDRAVRQTDLKMGAYYSLYEWFNPLYVTDPKLYVEKHMLPQMKDLVNKYAPAVIFSDGEWDHPDTLWKSKEWLAWLYNESPSKSDVVVNDRWGKDIRHHHGGYYTTEYGAGLPNAENPWEENRGMAYSFGYSRTENYEDYNSTQKLLYMLLDIVSRGGNFLLDIGPTADGRIPVIMQERLLEMGEWLEVNGEAIYGTTTWETTCQWSPGEVRDAKHGRGDRHSYDVMKLTVNPEPGFARKEIFFTAKGNNLYCICPVFPDESLLIKNVRANSDAVVTLLGLEEPLSWQSEGVNISVAMPQVNPSKMPCQHAYVFKISHVSR